MSVTLGEIEAFHQFAQGQVRAGSADSIAELFDQWLLEHPTDEQWAETRAAIRQGFADLDAGLGRPAAEATSALLRKHGIPGE